MNAVIYTRVSTEEQSRGGVSLDLQAAHCEEFCDRQGWSVQSVHTDAGYSAGDRQRPGLKAALDGLAAADNLVVWKLDRLARLQGHFWGMWEEYFQPQGKRLISVTEGFDSRTAAGRLLMGNLSTVAQYERELLAERVYYANRRSAQQGRYPGGMYAPYGYRRGADGTLQVDESQAPTVRLIFDRYLGGEGIMLICQELARLGIPSPAGRPRWSHSTLLQLIHNPVYAGLIAYGKRRYSRIGPEEPTAVWPGRHEPILSEQRWREAQELSRLRVRHKPGRRYPFLLTGLLRCRYCGGPMHGNYGQTRRGQPMPRYRCTKRIHGRACRGQWVAARRVERLVIGALEAMGREQAADVEITVTQPEPDERAALRSQLEGMGERRDRLLALAEQGFVDGKTLQGRLRSLGGEEKRLRAALRQARRRPPVAERPEVYRSAAAFLSSDAPLAHRRRALAACVRSVVSLPGETPSLRIELVGSDGA